MISLLQHLQEFFVAFVKFRLVTSRKGEKVKKNGLEKEEDT